MTEEEREFNIDSITFCNMLDGMSYEEAHSCAIKEFKVTQQELKEANNEMS